MPKNTTQLTDKLIKQNNPPKGVAKRIYGSDGLVLDIKASGNKYFYFHYTFNKKSRFMALGRYPNLSLEKAKEYCLELRYQLLKGFDPLEERKKQQNSYKKKHDTFETIAREWYARKAPQWKNPKHAQQVINTLSQYVFFHIGAKLITDVSTLEIMAIIDPLAESKPETASRVKQRINAIFEFAIQTGRVKHNPASNIPKIVRSITQKVKHHPALPRERIAEFFERLKSYPNRKVQLALTLLILTITRSGELRFGRWEELKGDEWHIPAERMKMKRAHIVPLSDWALEILDELKKLNKNSPYFVTGNRNNPISDMTLSMAMKRLGYAGIAVPHGFRAMASSILNESGLFNPDAIERQLAHVEMNKVRSAYNRAEYLEERHRMMQWYSDFIKNNIVQK